MKRYKALSFAARWILSLLLLSSPAPLFAQNIGLSWSPSASGDVAGYKIYYKADSAEQPLDGIEALEGPSPIDVGNVTTCMLTQFPEGSVYYFRAAAYDSGGRESELSNLVASDWIPATLVPETGETTDDVVTLVWSMPPEQKDLEFLVTYGTDPSLAESTPDTSKDEKSNNGKAVGKVKKDIAKFTDESTQETDTIVIAGLWDNYYTTAPLVTGNTYYWKVTAIDPAGLLYESEINSFIVQ
jgi:hypothetical protein